MNIYRLLPILGFLLLILVIDCGKSSVFHRRHYYRHFAYGAALLPVAAVAAAPYAVGVSPGIVFLLLLKVLALKVSLVMTRIMAIGALLVARGTSLLVGAALGNVGTLYLLNRPRHAHIGWGWQKAHRHHGLGWRHAHFPSWHKPRGNGWRSFFLRLPTFKLRWPITLVNRGKGWGGWDVPAAPAPAPYYSWPKAVSSGWGGSSSTPVVTSDSGWVESKPSSGWGASASASYDDSNAEYSAPVGEDAGWKSGNPPTAWGSSSKKRSTKATPYASEEKGSEEVDFMTGMASTYKEIVGDWFSSIKNLLLKNDKTGTPAADNSTTTDSNADIVKLLNKQNIKTILEPYAETEAFLEQQFNHIDANDEDSKEDKAALYLQLREAYMQKLLDELAIESKDQIPEFIPMPPESGENSTSAIVPEATSEQPEATVTSKSESFTVSQSSSSSHSEKSRSKRSPEQDSKAEEEVEYVNNLIGETRVFFTLLSAFDRDTCIQKLICDVHTRIEEAKEEGTYDYNVISAFKLVNALLVGDYKGSSMKYREAAYYGEMNRSEELCRKRYKACEHTSKEIIQMGKELE